MELEHLIRIQEVLEIARVIKRIRKFKEQEQAGYAEFLARLQREFDADMGEIDAELKCWEGRYDKKVQDMPPELLNFFGFKVAKTEEVPPEEPAEEAKPVKTPKCQHPEGSLDTRLIAFLNKGGRAFTSKEIGAAFPDVPFGSITGRLSQLRKDGRINCQAAEQGRAGLYSVKTPEPTPEPTPATDPVTEALQREVVLFIQHRNGPVPISEIRKYFEERGFSKKTILTIIMETLRKNPDITLKDKAFRSARQVPEGTMDVRVQNLLDEFKGKPMNINQVATILGLKPNSCGAALSRLNANNKVQRVAPGLYKSLI